MSESARDPENYVAAQSERHVLLGSPECLVEVGADGDVDITIDQCAYLSVERLREIVAFVEQHAQVTVCTREHDE